MSDGRNPLAVWCTMAPSQAATKGGMCCDGVNSQGPLTCPNCGQMARVQAITAVVSAGLTVGTSAGHSADVGRALFILLLILLLILLPIVVAFAGIVVA
jgi:hypothetical protein